MKKLIILLSILLASITTGQAQYHVTTSGTSGGDGSESSPWDIATALNGGNSVIIGGDTIYIHAGTYTGSFECNTDGSSGNYVCFIGLDGVIIDGNTGVSNEYAIELFGTYTHIENLEILNSCGTRDENEDGTIPPMGGVAFYGNYNRIVNCYIHDHTVNGVGFWSSSVGSKIYGCIICYNGKQNVSSASAHGIYMQNLTGTKIIKDNIVFSNFEYGLHGYTEGGNIQGFDIEGNTVFNNGQISSGSIVKANIIIGSAEQPIDRVTVNDNYLFHGLEAGGKNLEFGYGYLNPSAVAYNNVIHGSTGAVKVNSFTDFDFYNNVVVGTWDLARYYDEYDIDQTQYNWNNNEYYAVGTTSTPFLDYTWSEWRSIWGFDANSTYTEAYPTENYIMLRPNEYDDTKAYISVFNYLGYDSVSVDLSSLLSAGTDYYIIDVQNYEGAVVKSGTYQSGTINIPMNLTAVTSPIGNVPTQPTHTGDEFGVYMLIADSINYVIPPTSSFTASPNPAETDATITFTDESLEGDSAIVSWSWDFGDSSGTSTLQNPTYSYSTAGTYSVILTVTDSGSNTDQYSLDVTTYTPGSDVITAAEVETQLTALDGVGGTIELSANSVTGTLTIDESGIEGNPIVITRHNGFIPVMDSVVVTGNYVTLNTLTFSTALNLSGPYNYSMQNCTLNADTAIEITIPTGYTDWKLKDWSISGNSYNNSAKFIYMGRDFTKTELRNEIETFEP